jgi:hypothetical protein
MQELTLQEIDVVSGAELLPKTILASDWGIVGLGLGIAAAPVGILGATIAFAASGGGGIMTGKGLYKLMTADD